MRLKKHTALILKMSRKEKCEEYGLVYFYRKNELEKINISETLEQAVQ